MKSLILEEIKALSPQIVERIPYLKMLVLFGSQARGKTHDKSDLDFAALYDETIRESHIKNAWGWFEVPVILSQVLGIPDDKVDVVELNHCSPLLGYHVARDGKLLYERSGGEFVNFKCQAWKIYADTEKFRKLQQLSIELRLKKLGV